MKALRFIFLSWLLLSFLGVDLYCQSTFEKGYSALQEGEYEKGLDFLKKAASETPDNEVVYFYLGFTHGVLGQYDEALTAYTNAIKYGKDNKDLLPDIYFYRAGIYSAQRRFTESINDYTSAISYDKKNDKYLVGRGQCYSQTKKYAESDKDLNAALKLNPDNIDARIWLAFNESQRGNIDKAIGYYNSIIKSHPDVAEPYRLRAGLYSVKNNYKDAAADIVKALELNSSAAFNSMLQFAVDGKNELDANLEKAEKAHPGEPSWKYYRAIVCEMNGEYESAIELYKKANLLSPTAQTSVRIASCYYAMLEYQDALKYADEAVKQEPDNIAALVYRCEYQYDMGNVDGAISDMSKIIEQDPSDSDNFNSRGWYKTSKRDYEGARMDYTKAIAMDPEDANAYVSRGRILLIQGNREAANNDLRKAIQLDNDIENPQDAAAYALHFLGLDDEAASYSKKVLQAKERNGGLSAGDCYDAACLYSLINDKEKALYYLDQSIRKGYTRFYHFTRDTDLDNIRNEERFVDLMKAYWPKSIESLSPYGPKEDITDFEAPKFQDGSANDFSKWVNEQLVYPKNAKENGVQGAVILGFYVEKDGALGDLKVVVDVDPELDAEALRIVNGSPSWTPAKRNGEVIRYHYYFPVIFRLE